MVAWEESGGILACFGYLSWTNEYMITQRSEGQMIFSTFIPSCRFTVALQFLVRKKRVTILYITCVSLCPPIMSATSLLDLPAEILLEMHTFLSYGSHIAV
jgi:hypothetical protein